ncbi:peptidoglycan DD-metalloendopeptidase family protein [Hyphobacterium sp.]|uniref:peptidoglycan DD-metalloendopeptidase family protein n=1 Tax=Hyphobacterium sp. TaxID=2004662 RepID=UPI003BAB0CA2
MTGLVEALTLGTAFSLFVGSVLAVSLSLLGRWAADVAVWRTARWATILPIVLAPVIYMIPETQMALAPAVPVGSEPTDTIAFAVTDARLSPEAATNLSSWIGLGSLYLAGLTVSLLLCLVRHIRRARILARSRQPVGRETLLLEAVQQEALVRGTRFRITADMTSPALSGWQGVVLLPADLFENRKSFRFAVLHELMHVQRGDERDRLVGRALMVFLWFHLPLFWIERELDAVRELACDKVTLNALGREQRHDYAVEVFNAMRGEALAASPFGPHGRRHRKMRIESILNRNARTHTSAKWVFGIVGAFMVPVAAAQASWTERIDPPRSIKLVTPFSATAQDGIADSNETQAAPTTSSGSTQTHEAQDASFGPAGASAPTLERPVMQGRITSLYGPRSARPAGAPLFHGGVDIAAPAGTPITAAASGRVVHAAFGYSGSEAWGNTLVIDHGRGWQTVYAHMQAFEVAVGDSVTAGERIGRVGSSGQSTGPHVHLEVRRNGERVDPADFVSGLR